MEDVDKLKQSGLFKDIAEVDIAAMLTCLRVRKVPFKKGQHVLQVGETIKYIGIVLDGTLSIIKEDVDGERSLLNHIGQGEHFAEALCCAGVKVSPVTVLAESDGVVMFLDFARILCVCANTCVFHSKLIENMLQIVAIKNLQLQERMEYLSKKTIRKRVLKYLIRKSKGTTKTFEIPFNREELADYLGVDRSALSRELMRMKEEHIIDYWKNKFALKEIRD